jgi:pimeloyl-ACP methyl ester carboxylesterase
MVARTLALVLVVELLLYVGLGAMLVREHDWSVPGVVVTMLAVHVGLRVAIVLLSFVLARRHARGTGSRGLQLLKAFIGECAVILGPFAIGQMFPSRVGAPAAVPRTKQPPVLLVHGYLCNAAMWVRTAHALRRDGRDVHVISVEPVLGDIDVQAEALARAIDSITTTPGARVAVVAHSMGGLVFRAYARRHGIERVHSLMTLGSPHRGTALAPLGIGRCARQMERGSAWIEALWADCPRLAPLRITTLRTTDDNLVAPPDTTLLPGARVVTLSEGVSHSALPFSRAAIAAIREHLDRAD